MHVAITASAPVIAATSDSGFRVQRFLKGLESDLSAQSILMHVCETAFGLPSLLCEYMLSYQIRPV